MSMSDEKRIQALITELYAMVWDDERPGLTVGPRYLNSTPCPTESG